MSDAMFSAYGAMDARMRMVDIIANNLANVQTTGFKRDFSQILETVSEGVSRLEVASQVDVTPGVLVGTGRDLDAAIDGSGFFVIETEAGNRYTRNGSFAVNSDGELVLQDGHRVLGRGDAPIFVGSGRVQIQDGGDVLVDGTLAGTLRVVDFADPRLLRKEGLFRMEWTGDPAAVSDVDEPRVKGGHLERSNVNSVDEMIDMMTAFREFESIAETLRSVNGEMNRQLLGELADLT